MYSKFDCDSLKEDMLRLIVGLNADNLILLFFRFDFVSSF